MEKSKVDTEDLGRCVCNEDPCECLSPLARASYEEKNDPIKRKVLLERQRAWEIKVYGQPLGIHTIKEISNGEK